MFIDKVMKFLAWLWLFSTFLYAENLAIEAFWLGELRFAKEMAPDFGDKEPTQKAASLAHEESKV